MIILRMLRSPHPSYRSNGMQRRIGLRPRSPICPSWRQSASPAAPSGSLPVVLRIADAGNTATEEIKHPKIETQTETPTLGVRLTQAPLILQRTPVTERVSAPSSR